MFAFTFPGQGSQQIGMGREWAEKFTDAKAVFEEVDEALGEKLSNLIWNGSEEELTLTRNAQPALMAVSLAIFRVLEKRGLGKARFIAGHSLGEYSALAAGGAFSVSDAARLLRIRGQAMQDAVPLGQGAMAAIIGLEEEEIELVCRESAESAEGAVCQIANDNGGGQWVISGDKGTVEDAMARASEKGAKRAIALAVSAPFHCELMQDAARRMQEALAEVEIADPKVPLVCNVLASAIDQAAEIRERLVEQITGRVRWRESVNFMAREGVNCLFEIGSGKVLSGLARRIDRDLKTVSVNSESDMDALFDAISQESDS